MSFTLIVLLAVLGLQILIAAGHVREDLHVRRIKRAFAGLIPLDSTTQVEKQ